MKRITLILMTLCISICAKETQKLPLRGQASYSWLFFDVYDAKLWTRSKKDFFSRNLEFELAYKRSLKGSDIFKQTQKEILHAGHQEGKVKKWMSTIPNLFPDVKDGDKILASFDPQRGITFYLNHERKIGEITDLDFARAFLNIWLGEEASDQKFRNKLLGLKGN